MRHLAAQNHPDWCHLVCFTGEETGPVGPMASKAPETAESDWPQSSLIPKSCSLYRWGLQACGGTREPDSASLQKNGLITGWFQTSKACRRHISSPHCSVFSDPCPLCSYLTPLCCSTAVSRQGSKLAQPFFPWAVQQARNKAWPLAHDTRKQTRMGHLPGARCRLMARK